MRTRPVLPLLAASCVALGLAGCGSSGKAASTPHRVPQSTATTIGSAPGSSPPTRASTPSVTAQPATTAPPGLADAMPLGTTTSVTTPAGHTLGINVESATQRSATVLQVHVQLTADGPPSTVQPDEDFRVVDTAGDAHGAALTTPPVGCAALPATATVSPEAPVTGCLVFTLPAGTRPAQVTFAAGGSAGSGAVAWKVP